MKLLLRKCHLSRPTITLNQNNIYVPVIDIQLQLL